MRLLLAIFACVILSASATYVETEALEMVTYSGISYCHPDKIKAWSCGNCNQANHLVNVSIVQSSLTDVQCFLGYDATLNRIIIAFRGTNPLSIQDWIDDLNFAPRKAYVNCDNCEVHSGFIDCYDDMQPEILHNLRGLMQLYRNASIHITGHSLGAAMAELCAVDVTLQFNITLPTMYTFGEPRVGNQAFRDYYTTIIPQSYRVIHYADPVPHLPLEIMGFYHQPQEVFYNEGQDSFKVCDMSGEDGSCADGLLLPLLVTDHLNYLKFDFVGNYLNCAL